MKQTGTKRRTKSKLESGFQEKAIDLIESMGGYVNKTHVSSFQSQGEPDIDCCYKGYWVSFELKIKGNKASELQLYKLDLIRKSGGIAKEVYTLEEIKETLYELSRIQQDNKS